MTDIFDEFGNYLGKLSVPSSEGGAFCCLFAWPFIIMGILFYVAIILPIKGLVYLFQGNLVQALVAWFITGVSYFILLSVAIGVYSRFAEQQRRIDNIVAQQERAAQQLQDSLTAFQINPPVEIVAEYGKCLKIETYDCPSGTQHNYLVITIHNTWKYRITVVVIKAYKGVEEQRMFFDKPNWIDVNVGKTAVRYALSQYGDITRLGITETCVRMLTRTTGGREADFTTCVSVKP